MVAAYLIRGAPRLAAVDDPRLGTVAGGQTDRLGDLRAGAHEIQDAAFRAVVAHDGPAADRAVDAVAIGHQIDDAAVSGDLEDRVGV